ncbi:MAG: biotin--[acetyl-CoA-carboxylase] ligase, partial [Verrucomicrobiota bacterium]
MNVESFREIRSADDEFMILETLLNANGDFVSGSVLAEQLNISRPGVLGKINKLREHGFAFEAVRNKGYRLTAQPETIHPSMVRYHLQKMGDHFELLYFPVIDSTNTEAERQIAKGKQAPFAIISSCQTMGRGRLGRDWYSASADNLYLTVLFEPNIPTQQLQPFTMWAGIYICRALQDFISKSSLKIKWPNDLQCEGRKFAGMLTEARVDADLIRTIIFGIGINVNSNPNDYPLEIKNRSTSLHAINGEPLNINEVAAAVLAAANTAFGKSIDGSNTEKLKDAWAPLSALRGQTVTSFQGN